MYLYERLSKKPPNLSTLYNNYLKRKVYKLEQIEYL